MRIAALCALLAGTISASAAYAATKLPFTFDAMMQIARIDEPKLSPDGKLVAFTVKTADLPNNTMPAQIYVVPVSGGPAQKITSEGHSNTRPRWTPDSKRILFVSDRANSDGSQGSQIWWMNADGTDAKALTNLPTQASDQVLSPDGKTLLFTSNVYPSCASSKAVPGVDYDGACNKTELVKEAANKMKARVYTSLLYRSWTAYQGSLRKHILVQALDGSGKVRDLTPGNLDTPPVTLGGPEPYDFSPDSTQVTYVTNLEADLAMSTNSDLMTVPVAGGDAKRLTTNLGADEGPSYSPDGKYLAFRTQTRAGYESDQWRLAVMDLQSGVINTLTDSLDRWVESYTWAPDSRNIFFTVDEHGTMPVLMMPATGGPIRTIAQGRTSLGDVQFAGDGKTMIYTEQSGSKPAEIFKATSKGGAGVPLTHLNDAILAGYHLTSLESITVDGADGAKIESFVVKPPGFKEANKYPVLIQIHGGPQGEWGESWTYRWNAQLFAAAGFIVVLPNPHGSVGYGQAFTDAVNSDWGGRAYDDIMATTDYVSGLPYVDRERMAAAGGSYGGYMVDWILGHTDRFKALVSHAGVFDLRSEAGTTDELWFPKWEMQGLPWENNDLYEKWSPSSYVKNFKTPTLVIQGEIDYRVPIGQGEQLFTSLQEMKVPSKLVQFPDEGHWVGKPQDSQFWYATVTDWLTQYTKPAETAAKPTLVQ